MKDEVSSAVVFIAEKLYGNIAQESVERFRDILLEAMLNRFKNHWHPERPLKGNAFRCLNIEDSKLDPFLQEVVLKSGLSLDDLVKVFPNGLALWIDPNDVSYRLGKGSIAPIYRRYDKPSPKSTTLNVNSPSFTPRIEGKPRVPAVSRSYNGQHARFSPPPGFSNVRNVESSRFSPVGFNELKSDFSTTWSTTTSVPTSTWSDSKSVFDSFSNGDGGFHINSQDKRFGFENFPRNNGWKTVRKPKYGWYSATVKSNDRFNRFHWYKDESISTSIYDKQPFEFQGIPQEVY